MNAVLNLHEIPKFFIFFGFRALFDRYVSYFMYAPKSAKYFSAAHCFFVLFFPFTFLTEHT